jgi:hypothetical protein
MTSHVAAELPLKNKAAYFFRPDDKTETGLFQEKPLLLASPLCCEKVPE